MKRIAGSQFERQENAQGLFRQPRQRAQAVTMVLFVLTITLAKVDLSRHGLSEGFAQAVAFIGLSLLSITVTSYIFEQSKTFRNIAFYSTIKPRSWLQWFRRRSLLILIVSVFLSLALTIAIQVYLLTVGTYTLVAMTVLQFWFPQLRSYANDILSPELKPGSRSFVRNALTVFFLSCATAILMICVKYWELQRMEPSVLSTSDGMASHVIASVTHAFPLVQDLGRTLSMFELELLRAKTLADPTIGKCILIYCLLPSITAALALPRSYAGFYDLVLARFNEDSNSGT